MFVEIKQSGLSRAKDYFWQPFAKIKLTVLSLSLSIYLSFYSFGHRLSSILSARFFLVTKLLSPLCSTEQWKGEREKEREREVHEPLCSTELPNSLCRWWNNGPFGMHVLLFQYPPKPVAAQFSPHVFTCFEQLIFMPSSAFPPPFLLLTNALSTAAVSHLPADRLSHAVSWASNLEFAHKSFSSADNPFDIILAQLSLRDLLSTVCIFNLLSKLFRWRS